jgi:DNA ligase-1
VTEQFPDLLSDLAHLPDGSVIDGEIVAWGKNRPLSFNHLQRRLGRKTVLQKDTQHTPVHFIAYDLLEHRGEDMRKKPLQERHASLSILISSENFTRVHCSEVLVFNTWKELEALRTEARERGVEGLMIKDRASAYGTGRKKGAWWKYKVDPLSLDAVLMYAQPGSGKRANLFTDYTFGLWKEDRLVPLAKAYSGLSNVDIEQLDRWIRRNTVERFGPVRLVQPHHVFEIGFDGISKSTRHKSGVAARFPRILRWRKDKRPEEADNLETALNLIE